MVTEGDPAAAPAGMVSFADHGMLSAAPQFAARE
jgi:hypothetical protein